MNIFGTHRLSNEHLESNSELGDSITDRYDMEISPIALEKTKKEISWRFHLEIR